VSSEPGTGTWVHVALPCIEERAPEEPGDATPSEPAARNVILIVDDQLNVRLVLSTWLEAAAGFEVLTASDGEAAISLFSERPDQIDLVVMDLSMPRMDGSEAMGHIRAIRPDIPIILSSGYGERTVRSKLQDHEPTAFVQKPYEPQVMVDLIQSVLAERRAGDSA
jgi:CheY-like chemotaxis protein